LAFPTTSKSKLVLVKQYRFAVEGRLLEFTAGILELDEKTSETIKREIQEEIVYYAKIWHFLGKFPLTPGYSDEYIYVFCPQDLKKLKHLPEQDKEEHTEVVLMTFSEFEIAIFKGKPIDAESISSFFMTRLFLDKING
jgi:ADP-ribose pyrophosphatase